MDLVREVARVVAAASAILQTTCFLRRNLADRLWTGQSPTEGNTLSGPWRTCVIISHDVLSVFLE